MKTLLGTCWNEKQATYRPHKVTTSTRKEWALWQVYKAASLQAGKRRARPSVQVNVHCSQASCCMSRRQVGPAWLSVTVERAGQHGCPWSALH
jgi:hypothetical protein